MAHNRLGFGSPGQSLFAKHASKDADSDDDDNEMTGEMQRLKIIEEAKKRAIRHKNHNDSMGGVTDRASGARSIRSRDSMVMNKVRLTDPKESLFDPARPDDGKPLHKGWLLKNPIAERASIKAKWKAPNGRAKRRWFVLHKTSDRKMPSLSYYTDEKQSTLKGTLHLGPTWNVQRVNNSGAKKHTFELYSERQGVLVEADSAEDSNVWMHYIETLLRHLKRVEK